MFSRLFTALGRIAEAAHAVADSLFGLSATLKDADAHVRGQLGLTDRLADAELLPAPEAAANGRRPKRAS